VNVSVNIDPGIEETDGESDIDEPDTVMHMPAVGYSQVSEPLSLAVM